MNWRLLRARQLQAWVLWGLVFALPLFGISGTLTQWLGAQHYHRDGGAALAHASPARAHHTHASLKRHHHVSGDATVARVGADSKAIDGDGGTELGTLVQVVALASAAPLWLRTGLSQAWPHALIGSVAVGQAGRLERPPDA